MSDAEVPARRAEIHRASWKLRCGPVSTEAEIEISSRGLIAVGALVSGILLSVAPIIWVSTRKAPRR
ncbi:hypothetical protein [Hansschlegelia sp.]|uniref:hypothetical protein n=1 Tax=Hansschlegelia sp. TaxID=2041892 RepID=UPI002BDC197C|nr:hypothetical protein [Hansschlegelia sp.]HVI30169.1 hypothetical protein [Hansschlegelia sp.]